MDYRQQETIYTEVVSVGISPSPFDPAEVGRGRMILHGEYGRFFASGRPNSRHGL